MTNRTNGTNAIELVDVAKKYRTHSSKGTITALAGVDLAVKSGEIFGLVGESGSGKTTLGRLILRLEKPDTGRIQVGGQQISNLKGSHLKTFRQRVQMIFQDPYQSLNPYMSVLDTVSEPLIIRGALSRDQRRHKVVHTLTVVGLTPVETFLRRYPHQLSGGQRQRVAIARAMVLDPDIVVADEPTSMLDATMSVQIYQLLSQIQKQRRMTLVFITHSLAAAHYLCDRIAVIYKGHVVETGPAQTVISDPRHPYSQALLDALPKYGHLWSHQRYNALRSQPRSDAAPSGCPFYPRCNTADTGGRCKHQKPDLRDTGSQVRAACFYAPNRADA